MSKKTKKKRSMADRRRREHKGAGGGFCYAAPELPQFKGKAEESYPLDFVPFTAGKNNPFAKKGELYYERTYHQHPNVGPGRDKVICNLETFKQPCYICEYRAKKCNVPPDERTKESKAAYSALMPKQRQVFLVRNRDEMKKGLQFWDESWHLFGKFLDNKLKTAKGSQRAIRDNFAEPDGGSTLVITGVEKAVDTGKCVEFTDITFEPRKKPLNEELLESAPCVDDWFTPADYDEVKKLFLAGMGDEKDEDEEDEDEDSETDDEEWDEEDEDSEEEDEEEDEDSEDEDEEEESDDEEDDDEDSEDDEEEDESDEPPCGKGDLVLFKYKKKKLKGKVVEINKADDMVRVKSKDRDEPHNLEYDQVIKVLKSAASEDDEDEPRKKKKKRK